jgi:subtilase family protein
VPLRGVIRTGGTPKLNATPAAVRYAADHGAKIISMSLGGFVYEGENNQPCPTELQSAVLYALKKGALVVAASGNSGSDGSPVEEPGVCLGVVSVGAVDSASKVTDFSSRHPYLTVTAPGDEIPTLSKVAARAFIGGGTSQATAITSAALAMIWSKYPTATNEQVLSRLLSTATDAGPKGRDPQYGVGVINPNAAINEVAPPAQQNLVFAGVQPLLALGSAKPGTPAARPVAGSASAPIGAVSMSAPGSPLGAMFYALAAISVLLLGIAGVLLVVAVRRKPRPLTGYGF